MVAFIRRQTGFMQGKVLLITSGDLTASGSTREPIQDSNSEAAKDPLQKFQMVLLRFPSPGNTDTSCPWIRK